MWRRVAVVCAPALSFGCSVLLDLDNLQHPPDAGSAETGADGSTVPDVATDSSMVTDVADAGSKTWLDDFNRADGKSVGNGWIMKTPDALTLESNRVMQHKVTTGYHDNVVYRPAIEDVSDVSVSLEFKTTALPPGYPQVLTRIQQSTVGNAASLDCYILFIPNQAGSAVLGRQRGYSYLTTLRTIPLGTNVDTAHSYRLTLTTTGASPVVLNAVIEVFTSNAWMIIGSVSHSDADMARLDTGGSVGFSESGDEADLLYSYDNFIRTAL